MGCKMSGDFQSALRVVQRAAQQAFEGLMVLQAPTLGYDFDQADPTDANVVSLPKPGKDSRN